MHAFIVEEVAIQTPSFIEDLLPFGLRVQGHLELCRAKLRLRILILFQVDDRKIPTFPCQDFLSIRGEMVAVDVSQDGLLFTLLEIVEDEGADIGTRGRRK